MIVISFSVPKIHPTPDLHNKTHEISHPHHTTNKPTFITKNDKDDLIIMSVAAYERDQARLELYRLLDEAEADVRAGDKGASVATVRRRLRSA